eukprot:6465116-Amphidinium_carterae.1
MWEMGVFGKILTAVEASTKLPSLSGRSVASINAATMPASLEEASGYVDAIGSSVKLQYERWCLERCGTQAFARHCSQSCEVKWGTFDSIITYNVNKLPWTLIPDYIDMMYAEATFSILCLQGVFDDTGYDNDEAIDGWWDVNGHRVLATKTFNGSLLLLVLHKSYVTNNDIPWATTRNNVAATVSIHGISTRVIGVYFPHSGYDKTHPDYFPAAINYLDNECNMFRSVIVLGDYNAWVGRMRKTISFWGVTTWIRQMIGDCAWSTGALREI